MHPIGDDHIYEELRACTAELAEIVSGDLERPVPTCPEWTFRQLATHVGRGHRWAAEIVATRAAQAIPWRQVPDGKLPDDPARQVEWLSAAAARVIAAVTAAGGDLVWTFFGTGPAGFWARRRAHEVAVHLADAQLATGRDVNLAAGLAADGIDEWLGLIAAGTERTTEPARARSQQLRGDGHTLHFHASDDGLDGAGEWLVRRTPSRITVEPGHARADVAVRGPAVRLLLVLTRRLPPSDPAVEILGDQTLLTDWLDHTPF